MIKRFFILLLAIVASVGMSWASVTWISDQYGNHEEKGYNAGTPFTKDGVTVTMSDNAFFIVSYWGDASLQCIEGSFSPTAGNYVFSNSLGENFVKIIIAAGYPSDWESFPKGDGWVLSGDEYNGYILTWTGNASTVTLMDNELHSVHQSIEGDIVFYFESDSEEPAPAKLPGAFTINANGDKIVFSRGNLQATTTDLGANWTWDFAPNQWSLIGDAAANNAINGNKTVSANGTVDLFGWSTAATYYGINKSWNNDDYTGDFVDWGALMGTEWRTLSRAEFRYIVFDRAQAFNKQGKATVNGVSGYIFLPDEWELPSGLSFTPSPGDYTTNQYDGTDWDAMEAAGAVFLPAAGDRSGTDIYMYDYGWYWTSTSTEDSKAYYLYFYKVGRDFVEHNRYDAKSVRLVTTAPKTPSDVMTLINAIGTVDSSPESKAKIDAAREAYETLSDADKALVTNYETLTNAETAYNNLFAQDVIDKIALLPTTIKLPTYDLMVAAREAYDALTADQKALVPAATLTKLTDLEAAFAAIGGGGSSVPGALKGAFTINAGGDKISFAKGNLQATTTDLGVNWTWGFAANQWDIIGNAVANNKINGNGTVSENGTVDLFGWVGASSTWTGAAQYGISNSTADSDTDGYGNVANEALKSDWGTTMGSGWYTLTKDEWKYLLNTREGTRYCKASVNSKNGLVIFPDNYSHPTGVTAVVSANTDNVAYTTNSWSGDDWTKMEKAGCVFLPTAGCRQGTSFINENTSGYYWSSSFYDEENACNLEFNTIYLNPTEHYKRKRGFSVRLVTEAVASDPIADAKAVLDLINAIPDPVTLEDACVNAIQSARAAVTALGENASLIDASDMTKLTDAEQALKDLNQAEADKVVAKINNIPQPVTLTLATRDSIQNARAAYDALTADQKALVPAAEYQKLLDAEAALAEKNPGGGMPADALNGKFTINADGDQIAFAKGNLQATTTDLGANWTWGFAANQWNCLMIVVANSKIDGNGTVSENGTVDLFGWSTAATYYGINNSDKFVDYPGDFVDWGPNMGAGWRTLTKDEWNYLIENNTKGRATVNDKNGYIFLPNDWSGPAFTPDPNNFTTNVYSGDDWTAMENAGAVFLPCGPARNRNSALIANDVKYYSSTSLNNDSSYVFTIYYNQSQSACTVTSRAYGCMVRLVTEGSVTPLDSAQVVKDLIDAIPVQVSLEDACVNAVQAARDAYNALADATKGALDAATVDKLNQAITDYTALIQAGADAVKAKIAAIPQPVKLKLATRDSIENARAAYDALTADQQALVTNYGVLTAAEATLAEKNPGGGAPLPEGALTGAFSINADGDKIAFSKGNLQATTANLGETWTWAFAANQYDYIGNAVANTAITGNKTVSTNGTIDLFGWSTAATYYGINNSNVSGKHPGDFIDWGETIAEGWRTLTRNEWGYLFETRTDAASKYGHATVAGIHGIIVLPDSYKGTAINADHSDWSNNIISAEDWAAYEANGVAFLPAAGSRLTTNVNYVGEYGLYWTSTTYAEKWAYRVRFLPNLSPDYGDRVPGHSVRLVTAHTGSATPLDSAQVVKDLIEAIPAEITLDAACVNAVQAARDAYNALAEATKGALDDATVQKLTDAEADLTALNQAEADKVIAKINNIPLPVELKLATRDSIESARAAYDALNADQKALVPDAEYQKLLDAEAALAEKNQGGSASVDIVWDINTGIANVDPNTTSPAYDGITITTGNGNRFYQTTTDPAMLCFFFTGSKGSYAFAKEDGTHFTKVELISSAAMSEWLLDPSRIGTDWLVSDDYKKATWIGDADTVKIWDGAGATSWVNVDSIVFTVSGTATPLDSAQHVKDLIDAILTPVEYPTSGAAIEAALNAFNELSDAAKGALDDADVQKLTDAEDAYAALIKEATDVIALINAIPQQVVYNEACGVAITAARNAYDALDDSLKPLVSNYSTLTDAETAYSTLKDGVDDAIAKIDAIPSPVEYTDACKDAIDAARNAYDALNNDQKAAISTAELQKLTDAEAAYAAQKKAAEDQAAADAVVNKINAIGEVEYSNICKNNIEAARAAYDALTDDQKARVTAAQLQVLTDAEAAYAALAAQYEHNVTYLDNDDATLQTEMVALVNFPEAPEVNGFEFVRWDIVPSNLLEQGVIIQGVYASLITLNPVAYDTLVYNGAAQTLIVAGQSKVGHLEYRIGEGAWSATLPQAKDAGAYDVIYKLVQDGKPDYIAPDTIKLSIAKTPLVVTADDKEVIFGDEAPANSVSYTGFFGTDDASVLTGNVAYACNYIVGSSVGEYAITPSGTLDALNYTISYAAGKLTVKPAPLTITAENKSVIYGDAAPQFTVVYSGWKVQDSESVLLTPVQYTTAYVIGSSVGVYDITPHSATAQNYDITFVNGTLTVNKAVVYVSGAVAQEAKFADGHAIAVVLNQGTLNGIKLNDPLTHVTTATFSSADVAEHLTITLFYELQGSDALLANYDLQPTSEVFSTDGVIIEPFLPNDDHQPEEGEQVTVEEGIDVYAYGYCDGNGYYLKYHLNSGYPDQYKIDFADSRFTDVTYPETSISGRDGTIAINIPVDMPTGDYTMTVTFRDSRFPWLESNPFNVTFHVNLPETYVTPLFGNVIALVDTCNCFTDIQWYHRDNSTDLWQPIPGATGHYYHVDGKLAGEYFVQAKMDGVPTYTCGQADMETLYGADKQNAPKLRAYPNPVVNTTQVVIENADSFEHNMRIVNMMGVELLNTQFQGHEKTVDMSGYVQGNYMISVDGIVVKVVKQ